MNLLDYRIRLSDGAYGPGDLDTIIATERDVLPGSDAPEMRGPYLLLRCVEPTVYRGEPFRLVTLAPRYTGDTIDTIRSQECVVAVGRVLPHSEETILAGYDETCISYLAVGVSEIISSP